MPGNYATLAEAVVVLLKAQKKVKQATAALYRAEYSIHGRWDEGHRLSVFESRLHNARARQAQAEAHIESLCTELDIVAPKRTLPLL